MLTFLEKYNEIFQTNDWKYYENINCNNPFSEYHHPDDPKYFINEYFKTASKDVFDKRFNISYERNMHTISVFFLGISLRRMICGDLDFDPDFRYLWFLTCLYHDYGYIVEDDKKRYSSKLILSKLLKELDIELDVLNRSLNSPISRNTIKKYYMYCTKHMNFINHGIVGGALLYDKLKKNFRQTKNEIEEKLRNGILSDDFDGKIIDGKVIGDFKYNNLMWRESHEDYYKFAASKIILHNIWYCPKEDKEKEDIYRKYKLDELILGGKRKEMKYSDDPFLFLLLIADTIEPVKAFYQLKPRCVLSKINIDLNPIEKKINIEINDTCINPKEWFKRIKDLETWLQVKVDIDDYQNTLIIQLKD